MRVAKMRVMLRISSIEFESTKRLRIEGRITAKTADELAKLAETTLTGSTLDMSGVTFVDRPSIAMIQRLRAQGARLERCSPFLSELLRGTDAPGGANDGAARGSSEVAENDFVSSLRSGDERAFAALVRREAGRMLATARRLLGNDADAEDAVQEAFLQAHRSLPGFAGEARISTWLHRIVVNAALMKLRTRRRKPEQPIDDLMPRFDDAGAFAEPVTGFARSTDELVENAECRAVVRRAIERLPEAYRRVLVLRDIEGFDTDETAAALDSTPNAIKVRLHRARQALRTLLVSELGDATEFGPHSRRGATRTESSTAAAAM
jgi:RNA polymerase sigma-70 factor (ECF subfamily)